MSFWVRPEMVVSGAIPEDMAGTVFRNGPGNFTYGSQRLDHFFDGDGMVVRLAFDGGELHFANAYVRTPEFEAEQRAGRFLYRSVFSTGNPTGQGLQNPLDMKFKNPANTGVLAWAGLLFAFNEAGLPMALDPRTLGTVATNCTGLDPAALHSGDIRSEFFHAHYRVLEERGAPGEDGRPRRRLVGLGSTSNPLARAIELDLYEFAESGRMLHRTRFPLPGAMLGFFHDFLVTDNYYVVVENPTELDLVQMGTGYLLGRRSLAECIAMRRDRDAVMHLLPRPGAHPSCRRRSVPLGNCFVFHQLNAYEVPGAGGAPGRLVADLLPWGRIEFRGADAAFADEGYWGDAGNRSHLTRVSVDLRDPDARPAIDRLSDRWAEMPTMAPSVAGREHRYAYTEASYFEGDGAGGHFGPAQGIAKVTLDPAAGVSRRALGTARREAWYAGPEGVVSEATFVPRVGSRAEDDGYLVSLVYNTSLDVTEIVVLDARRLAGGPVATVRLPFSVPHQLHSSWDPGYFGPEAGGARPGPGEGAVVGRLRDAA